jgi:hypothetical protein
MKKLQAQADALVAKKSSAVIEKIRDLMAQHCLTTADIEAHTGVAKGGAKRGTKPGAKRAGKSAVAAPTKKTTSQGQPASQVPESKDWRNVERSCTSAGLD